MSEGRNLELAGCSPRSVDERGWSSSARRCRPGWRSASRSCSTSATRRRPTCCCQEANPNSPERTAATNLALASLDSVMFRVKRRIGSDAPVDDLRKRVRARAARPGRHRPRHARPRPTAEEAARAARTCSPRRSWRCGASARSRRSSARSTRWTRRSGTGRRQRRSTESSTSAGAALAVDKALATGDVEIADPAVPPPSAAAPRPLRYAAIAGLLGLLFADRHRVRPARGPAPHRREGRLGDLRRADPRPRAHAPPSGVARAALPRGVPVPARQRRDAARASAGTADAYREGRRDRRHEPAPGQRQEHGRRRARRTRSRSAAARCWRSTATCASRRWGSSSACAQGGRGLAGGRCSVTTTPEPTSSRRPSRP